MNNLYFDIETLPRLATEWDIKAMADPSSVDPIELQRRSGAPSNWKDPVKLASKLRETIDKTGLNANQGIMLSITWAIDDGPVLTAYNEAGTNEGELVILNEFFEQLGSTGTLFDYLWIGHNILTFDLPWIWRRCIKYMLHNAAAAVPHGKYWNNVLDTMQMWAATDWRAMTSLNTIAEFLGVEGKSNGIDGSMIADMFRQGKHAEIIEYAKQDVSVTRQVFSRIDASGRHVQKQLQIIERGSDR